MPLTEASDVYARSDAVLADGLLSVSQEPPALRASTCVGCCRAIQTRHAQNMREPERCAENARRIAVIVGIDENVLLEQLVQRVRLAGGIRRFRSGRIQPQHHAIQDLGIGTMNDNLLRQMIDLGLAGKLIERRRGQRHIAVRIATRGPIIKGTRGDDRRHERILARVGLNSKKMVLLGKRRLPAHERLIGLNHDVSDMRADARQRRGRTTEHQAPFKKLEAALLPSHRGGTRSLLGTPVPDR